MKKKKIPYLDNEVFQKLLVQYNSGDKSSENELADCLYRLAGGVAEYYHYFDENRDDLIQDGVVFLWSRVPLYDPKLGKAFNWFTTCMMHKAQQYYRGEQNYQNCKVRYKLFQESKMGTNSIKGNSYRERKQT